MRLPIGRYFDCGDGNQSQTRENIMVFQNFLKLMTAAAEAFGFYGRKFEFVNASRYASYEPENRDHVRVWAVDADRVDDGRGGFKWEDKVIAYVYDDEWGRTQIKTV